MPFHSSIEPLSKGQQTRLRDGGFHRPGCPVALSGLRVLTVSQRDWEGNPTRGQLVVNAKANGPGRALNDVTIAFHCRQAAASPCTGNRRTGTWSNHAYGLAVDPNRARTPMSAAA